MDEKNRLDELQRKIEEIRQTTIAAELVRLESFATSHVSELVASRRSEEDLRFNTLLKEAEKRRSSEEAALLSAEKDVLPALETELKKRADARRRDEGERRKKAEEDRIRQEAARKKTEEETKIRAEADLRKREEEQRRQETTRKKVEEENRLRAEAEQRKRKEEERQRAEMERKKKEEEQRRQHEAEQKRLQEEERHRLEQDARKKLEEDLRRQEEERRLAEEAERVKREEEERLRLEREAREKERKEREARIQSHVSAAKALLKERKFDEAAAEVAEVLAIDGAHPEALKLDTKIKAALAAQQEAPAEEKPAKPSSEERTSEARSQKKRSPALLVLVIVAGALLVGAVLFFQLKKSVFPSTTSFAVLPWTAGTLSEDERIVGSSIAEEVVREFEETPQVSVLGFSTAYGLTRRQSDPARSASNLGYPRILKGTVTRSADTFAFNIQLVDSNGNASWGKTFTKSQDALFTLPAEIAEELRDVLNLPAPARAAAPRTMANPGAYLLYLRGIELLHRHGSGDLQSSYALFHDATTQESGFGGALAAKAEAIALSYELGDPLRGATLEEAKNLTAEAIALDPAKAQGYIARGLVFDQLRQYKMALQQFENALQHSPNSSMASFHKAKVYLKTGQHEEGMNALTMAFRLNPRDPAILTLIAQTYQLARATQEGFWYHEAALHFVPDSTAYLAGPMSDAILTDATLTLSQSDRITAALQREIAAHPTDYHSMYRLARLHQLSGKGLESITTLAAAEKLLNDELRTHPQNADAMAYLALVLTRSGKFPEALILGRKAVEIDPDDAGAMYRLAQMYSLQMYSGKTMSVDEDVKKLCSEALQAAILLQYRFDELASGDLYNMYEHGDFKSLMKAPLK